MLLPNECPGLCRHRPGHLLGKNINKNDKNYEGFLIKKYGKFWSVSLEHYVEHKPLTSEEWNDKLHFQCIEYLRGEIKNNLNQFHQIIQDVWVGYAKFYWLLNP